MIILLLLKCKFVGSQFSSSMRLNRLGYSAETSNLKMVEGNVGLFSARAARAPWVFQELCITTSLGGHDTEYCWVSWQSEKELLEGLNFCHSVFQPRMTRHLGLQLTGQNESHHTGNQRVWFYHEPGQHRVGNIWEIVQVLRWLAVVIAVGEPVAHL